jgi:hypothetical protein
MATTNFTTSLKLALPTTGDLTGTWGQTVNDSITTLLDTAVAGNITKDMATLGTDWTLTSNNGATDEARYAILIPYGTTGATRSIYAPKVSKSYIVVNKTSASVIIRGGPTSPTTGVTVATGATVVVAWDSNLATPDFVAITPASISGVVPVANGGTGLTAVGTTGNVLTSNGTAWVSSPPSTTVTTATNLAGGSAGTIPYQSASGTTAMLAAGTATYVLTANGAAAPTWQPPSTSGGTVTSVSGTSPVSVATGTTTPVISMPAATTSVSGYLTNTDWNTFSGKLSTAGGTMTGAITFAAGQTVANLAAGSAGTIPYQSATGTTAMLSAGTSGQVLTSGGAGAPTWSAAPSSGLTLGTPVASTSGSSIDFTGLPSGVKQITVTFSRVTIDSTATMVIRLGGSGSFATSGYSTGALKWISTAGTYTSATDGFLISSISSTTILSGTYIFTLENSSTNKWSGQGIFTTGDSGTTILMCAGDYSIDSTLTKIRVTTGATFDGGEINIAYQ